jgi:predicted O-methyltransferase YrrM
VVTTVDFAFAFNYFGLSIRPGQFKNKITKLLNSVKELEPEHLMDIGTAKGGTLFLFCQVASPNAQVLSVDLPVENSEMATQKSRANCTNSSQKRRQEIVLIRKNAQEVETLIEAKNVLSEARLDLLFIDGDHL